MSASSDTRKHNDVSDRGNALTALPGPELVFGLVGPAGVDFDLLVEIVCEELSRIDYKWTVIRLSELLETLDKYSDLKTVKHEEERYEKYMDGGNNFRATLERGDALALLAVHRIRKIRKDITHHKPRKPTPAPRHAYILRRLVRREEVRTLRTIYGRGFFLIAAYSPRAQRAEVLSKKIADSYHDASKEKFRSRAEYILQRDAGEIVPEKEKGQEQRLFGQDVRKAFPMADLFIKAEDREEIKSSVSRFVKLIYSYPYHTPTRDESCMFHAQAAAFRSADLSRQVGAVISTTEGDIVAIGCNEVPKPMGGLFWEGDSGDSRDFMVGYDAATKSRIELLTDVLNILRENSWLSVQKRKKNVESLVKQELLDEKTGLMKDSQLMDLLEFGRSVHAEMAALMDASRRGVSVEGCTLYTTTFPCHLCAKHIIAAGISRVVYVEPYPKSRAEDLYPKSISVNKPADRPDMVKFEAFAGIASRLYMTLFEAPTRKEDEGNIVQWKPIDENARVGRFVASYLQIETKAVEWLLEEMASRDIAFTKSKK